MTSQPPYAELGTPPASSGTHPPTHSDQARPLDLSQRCPAPPPDQPPRLRETQRHLAKCPQALSPTQGFPVL